MAHINSDFPDVSDWFIDGSTLNCLDSIVWVAAIHKNSVYSLFFSLAHMYEKLIPGFQSAIKQRQFDSVR